MESLSSLLKEINICGFLMVMIIQTFHAFSSEIIDLTGKDIFNVNSIEEKDF